MFERKRWPLTLAIFLCTFLGVLQVYSASAQWAQYKFEDSAYFFKRQLLFAFLGFLGYALFSHIDLKKLEKYDRFFYLSSLLSLLLVLIPGIGVLRNGSRSWFAVGSLLVQPSEFFKIAMIFMAAKWCSTHARMRKFGRDLLGILLMMGIGFALIMLQPDFGSGIVMVCSIIVILLVADSPISYFVRMGLVGSLGLVGLILSAPYRLERITSFMNPWSDPLGSGFQIIQSLYAIAPGALFGKGFNGSIQKRFYLPEPQTDFIFAIFAEEHGFIGAFLLIALYVFIIYQGYRIAAECEDVYLSYVASGITALFAIQVLINLGVVVGLFPITGITLPLFSYGGSSLVVMLCSLGLLISIGNAKRRM